MEEFVGGIWHRFITRSATRHHPEAAVELEHIERTAGTLFRALGGDAGLRVAAAAEAEHGARRHWLSRLAGTDTRVAHASRDQETLRLPAQLALFAERGLNRDLYLWLIAQAAATPPEATDWLSANQQATRHTLAAWPGLRARYRRLVDACIALRIAPEKLPPADAALETAIRNALADPARVQRAPAADKPPQPVPLWLYPAPELFDRRSRPSTMSEPATAGDREAQDGRDKRRSARREDEPDGRDGFILPFRAESLLSWAEYVKVNRSMDEDPDADAARAADDMDELALSEGASETASTVRFDLDLPSDAHDDIPLQSGILLPEWDWKRQRLLRDHCSLTLLHPRDAVACELPARLTRAVRRLRSQFEADVFDAGQVVAGIGEPMPGFLAPLLVARHAAQDNHRRILQRRIFDQLAIEFHAGFVRHDNVQRDGVGMDFLRHLKPGVTIGGDHRFVAVLLQEGLQKDPDIGFIINYQHSF